MSAQYRPYRNEDGLDTDHVNWDEQELGDVQIYQKTTEDIRYVSNRNLIIGGLGVALLGILLGIVIGYFAHSEHAECVPSLAVALHSVRSEDSSIRGKILKMVDSEEIKKHIMFFSSHPHIAGSQTDKELAENIQQQWITNGLDKVSVESYDVLLSYPDKDNPNQVSIIDNQGNKINESQLPKNAKNIVPPYSAYSPRGNVSGELVFVNYGRKSDLMTLQQEFKINLNGKILIAKQFHLHPYEQVWNAYSVNAKGLILYPDPTEYNPPVLNMLPYPNSWWLPGDAARSDSVRFYGIGDPLTPGYPSKDGVQRISMEDAALPPIPVQPISYNEAYILLSSLGGKEAPESWQGGLNLTYHVGPELKEPGWNVQLEVNNEYINKTVYNVIGYIRGKTETDRYVLIGSGRDAWSYGATDAASGTAALLELSRVFSHLLKQGWRPRRTIIFCSWGAEQFSLTGSTEWLEEHYESLHSRAVAYIDASVLVTGNSSISVEASPLLYHAVFNATKEVPNPNTEEKSRGIKTVYDSWLLTFPAQINMTGLIFPAEAKRNESLEDFDEHVQSVFHNDLGLYENYMASAKEKSRPRIFELNVKHNYAPFHFSGIPVVGVTYIHDTMVSSLSYPVYHTEYDDFNFLETFIDPSFKYHAAVVQVLGEILRDLADSLFVPFNILDYAIALQDTYSTFSQKTQDMKKEVDLDYLNSALKNFTSAALTFHAAQESVDLSDPMIIRRINDQLLLLERAFQYYRESPPSIIGRDRLIFPYWNGSADISVPAPYHHAEVISSSNNDNNYFRLVAMLQTATQTLSDMV